MTWTSINSFVPTTTPTTSGTGITFSLTPSATGNLILLEVVNESTTIGISSIQSSNMDWGSGAGASASPVATYHATGQTNGNTYFVALFAGKVTTAGAAVVTVTCAGTATSGRLVAHEAHSTIGSWYLGASAHLDSSAGTSTWPTIAASGLAFGYAFNNTTAAPTTGTSNGWTIGADANGNGAAINPTYTSGGAGPAWTDGAQAFGIMAVMVEGATSTGSVHLANTAASGTSTETITSTGSVNLASTTASGTSAQATTSTGSFGAAAPGMSGTATISNVASQSIWQPTAPPTGASPGSIGSQGTNPQTLGILFYSGLAGVVTRIWYYSAPSSVTSAAGLTALNALPAAVALYTSTGTVLYSNTSPTWSGAAGSGWVSTNITSTVIAANTGYIAAVEGDAVSGSANYWNTYSYGYFGSGSPGDTGVNTGIVIAPGQDSVTNPSPQGFNHNSAGDGTNGTLQFPSGNYANANWWIDVTVDVPATNVTSTGHFSQAAPGMSGGAQAGPITSTGAFALPRLILSAGNYSTNLVNQAGGEYFAQDGAFILPQGATAPTGPVATGSMGIAPTGFTGTVRALDMSTGTIGRAPNAFTGTVVVAPPVSSFGTIAVPGNDFTGTISVHNVFTSTGKFSLPALSAAGQGVVINPVPTTGHAGLTILGMSGHATVIPRVTSAGSAGLGQLGILGATGELVHAMITDYAAIEDSIAVTVHVFVSDYAGAVDTSSGIDEGVYASVHEYAAISEAVSVHVVTTVIDYATAHEYVNGVNVPIPTASVSSTFAARTGLTTSVSSAFSVGKPFQGAVRQLALARWNFMYPS